MIIDTVRLSGIGAVTVRLTGNTQVTLNGRALRRSATGGRIFMLDNNIIDVQLDEGMARKDQELTLAPPITIIVNGKREYANVAKLSFKGEIMEIDAAVDQRRTETVDRLMAEARELAEREELLRGELEKRRSATRQLEQENQAEEQYIARLTDAAASLKQRREELTAVSGELAGNEMELAEVASELTRIRDRAAALNREFTRSNAERENAAQENEVTEAAIAYLREQLAKEKDRHDQLKQQEEKLIADLDSYNPDVIDALRRDIDTLKEQYDTAKDDWTKLSGEKRVWEKQLERQLDTNEGLSREIAGQPEELRLLQEAHEELSRRLTQIINAQEMCSEEKQRELRERIDEQEPIARTLTGQFEKLSAQADGLERIIGELSDARDRTLLELWPEFTRAFAEITRGVDCMNAEMEALQADAARFDVNVRACAERMERLNEWYHVDRTPLQRLRERLGDMTTSENERLLSTMDPGNVERVRRLFETVEAGLEELDDILRDVIRSAQHDEKLTGLKTSTNDDYARREMNGKQ